MTQVATILVKRQSDGYQLWGRRRDTGLYTTPGGKFEDNETPEQAAARELFEEAGIIANLDQLVKLGVREFPERNLTVHCFVVIVPDSVKSSSANDPDHEVSVWEWLPTMPIDTHAKPNALEPYAKPKFTLSTRKLQTRAKDASGHDHKANGQFGSGGSSGKKTSKGAQKPEQSNDKVDTAIKGKPLLGQGAYRKVYDAGDSVIKVAKTNEAKNFNKFEAENSDKSQLFAKVTEIGPGGSWIRQEKLYPIKDNDTSRDINPGDANLLQSLGVPSKDAKQLHTVKLGPGYSITVTALTAAVYAANDTGKIKDLPKSLNPLIKAFKDIQQNVPGLDIGDFAFVSNWGIDKNGKPKIADYSLTTQHVAKHSKPFTIKSRATQTRAPGQVSFTVIQSKIAPTENNKIFKFIASTNEVDRHGTRLLPRGCQHINFDKNPVFLWNHNKDGLPDDVIGRVLSLDITDSEVIATIEFLTERPDGSRRERAWQCWQDVLAGILKAVSVGFVPLAESPTFKSAEESAKYLAGGGIIDVTQWDLCELSLCPIGSNPDALQVRKLSMRKSFTISCRDVTDASGHKHAANGQFGSGGGGGKSDKPKKKLGDAANKHSAAAHEAKTHEAHSKAGKAHAAVARAALKRGDTDKATSALAQAKAHRDEAKRLKAGGKSQAKPEAKPEAKPVHALAPVGDGGNTGLVKNPEEPKSSGPKSDPNASKTSEPKGEAKPTRSDSPVPLTKGAKDAAAKATSLNAKGHFGHEKHDAIAAAHGEAASFHEAAAAAHRGNKSVGTFNDAGEHVTGNHSAAAAHDQAAELHREAQKAHLALGSNSRYAKLLRLSQNNPNVNEAQSAYESAKAQKEAVTGGSKVGLYIKQNDATKAAAAASKATKARNLLHSRALDDYDDSDDSDDDDVEPDDSVDLDADIEELEKLLAQKRYQARPFTIRRVPIHSKG